MLIVFVFFVADLAKYFDRETTKVAIECPHPTLPTAYKIVILQINANGDVEIANESMIAEGLATASPFL